MKCALPRSMRSAILSALAAATIAAPAAFGQAAFPAIFVGHYYTTYALNPPALATIGTLRINPDGSLTFLHTTHSGEWTQSVALTPDGRYLACGAGTSNSVVEEIRIFSVDADANLTQVFLGTVPDSPLDMLWLDDNTIAVTQSRFSSFSTIGVYRWDPGANTLIEIDREPVASSFMTNLAYDRTRRVLYSQDTNTYNIHRWSVGNDTRLTYIDSTPTGGLYQFGLSLSPSGDRLFAGCGTGPSIPNAFLAFEVSDTGLTPLAGSPFLSPANGPAWTDVTPDGQFLVIGHSRDSTVRTFALNTDGTITYTGFSFLVQALQGSIGEMRIRNDVVYVTDDTSAIDGVQGIHALRIGADGSLTPIQPILYTGTPRPEGGMAIWSPPVCRADRDGNGAINSADLTAFLADWFDDLVNGTTAADFDGNTTVNSADVSAFLIAWFDALLGPCP